VINHTGKKDIMEKRHILEILTAMDLERVPGMVEGDVIAILDHLRGQERCEGQGWHWECRCGMGGFEKNQQGVRLGG
jgi:hypothetical protein